MNTFLQILDFFIKASAVFLATPEGRKEWQDIREAAGLEKSSEVTKK